MSTPNLQQAGLPPRPVPAGTDVRELRRWMDDLRQTVMRCANVVNSLRVPYAPRSVVGGSAGGSSGLDLSKVRLGYSVSGSTITLLAGKLIQRGGLSISVSQASYALAGTQFFYVHHVRGSGAAAWSVAAVEPGNSATDIDVFMYQFTDGTLQNVGHIGDIDYDLPLA